MKRWFFLFFLFLAINVIVAGLDANMNNAGTPGVVMGNHVISWIIRAMIAFFCVFFSYPKGKWYQIEVPYPEGLWDLLFIYPASAWIVFDITYLKIREGVGLDYVGFTSYPDLFFYWIGEYAFVAMYLVKAVFLGAGIALKVMERNSPFDW